MKRSTLRSGTARLAAPAVARCALVASLCVGGSGAARASADSLASGAPLARGTPAQQGAATHAVVPFVVELIGPLQRVRFEHDEETSVTLGSPRFFVELEVALAPGERRRFVAPTIVPELRGLPLGAASAPPLVATDPPGAGAQVRVVVPPRGSVAGAASASERAARLVPPADDAPRRAPGVALVCLAVALPIVLARAPLADQRRGGARRVARSLLAIALTLAVAAVAVALDARSGRPRGDAQGDRWTSEGPTRAVEFRAPRSALRLGDEGRVVRVDVWTRAASLRAPTIDVGAAASDLAALGCAVTLDLSGVAAGGAAPVRLAYVDEGGGAWVLVAERGVWLVEREFSAGARLLRPEVNTWGACGEAWVREASGAWGRRGPWGLGAPLPDVAEGGVGGAPPGWLAAGLPQGVRVLVAQLAPGTWAGPSAGAGAPLRVGTVDRGGAPEGERWLRRTDF